MTIKKIFKFNLQNWIANKFNDSEMDKYHEFLDDLYPYEEGSHSLYEMQIYYKGVYDCLSQYESLLHSEMVEFNEDFKLRLPLECKDHAYNYFLNASLTSDAKEFTEVGRVSTIEITFEIEEEPNNA